MALKAGLKVRAGVVGGVDVMDRAVRVWAALMVGWRASWASRAAALAVALVLQGRILGGSAEFPGVVQAAVVVQVQIPAVIEVGAGGAVVGGRAQLVGFEAGAGGQPVAGGPGRCGWCPSNCSLPFR